MHYYKFNVADYRKDTVHLSPTEHYIYRQLIDTYYLDERPVHSDPKAVLRRLCLPSTDEQNLTNVLTDFFIEKKDGWHNKRIDLEISAYHEMAKTNKRIAIQREGRRKVEKHEACTKRGESVNEAPPNYKPLTTNHSNCTNVPALAIPEKKKNGENL